MNAIKKLFVAVIGVLLITFSSNATVNATETANLIDAGGIILSDETIDADSSEVKNSEDVSEDIIEDLPDITEEETYIDEQDEYLGEDFEDYENEYDSDIEETDFEDSKRTEKDAKNDNEKSSDKSKDKPSYSEKDLRLLACLVYTEAGNQPYEGMLAVANVVLNRVKSPVFSHANTIEEVIYDNKWGVQFSVTIKNSKTGKSILDKALECYDTGVFPGKNPETAKKLMKKAIKAAKAALNGENNIGDFLYFRLNNSKAASIKKKYEYKIIGDHIFYRIK